MLPALSGGSPPDDTAHPGAGRAPPGCARPGRVLSVVGLMCKRTWYLVGERGPFAGACEDMFGSHARNCSARPTKTRSVLDRSPMIFWIASGSSRISVGMATI